MLSEVDGQVYIGLRETNEFTDGSKVDEFIEFNPAYINSKVDFYENASLVARKDLPLCSPQERSAFEERVKNSNGIIPSDFQNMLCIPKESFQLYNVAGEQNKNSISLIFE